MSRDRFVQCCPRSRRRASSPRTLHWCSRMLRCRCTLNSADEHPVYASEPVTLVQGDTVSGKGTAYFIRLHSLHGVLHHHSSVQEFFQHSSKQASSDMRFCINHPIRRNCRHPSVACSKIPHARTVDMVFHSTQKSGGSD